MNIKEKIALSRGLTSKEKDQLIKMIDSGYTKEELIDYGIKEFYINIVGILND